MAAKRDSILPSTRRLLGLIPAAGSGTRIGAAVPKQYAALAGKTMLEHAIDALLCEPRIDRVLVVVAPGDTRCQALALDSRVGWAAVGGSSRAHSVRNGLRALQPQADDWIVVHDAARPCLSRDELTDLIDAVTADDVGGLLALPVADTLKRAAGGRATQTIDRSFLWRALTPQVFRAGLLERAFDAAGGLDEVTDEAAAIERLGLQPLLVVGAATNIKVTTPADWPLAEAILKLQGRWA